MKNLKRRALGTKRGFTRRQNLHDPVSTVGQKMIKLSGTCRSKNIWYLAQCSICDKSYTGRTVDPLQKRINGHRHCYKNILKKIEDENLQDIDIQRVTSGRRYDTIQSFHHNGGEELSEWAWINICAFVIFTFHITNKLAGLQNLGVFSTRLWTPGGSVTSRQYVLGVGIRMCVYAR